MSFIVLLFQVLMHRGGRSGYHPRELPRLAIFHCSLRSLMHPFTALHFKTLKNNEGIKEKGRDSRETYPVLLQGS